MTYNKKNYLNFKRKERMKDKGREILRGEKERERAREL